MHSGCARASPGARPIGLSFDAWMYHTQLGELIDRAMFESNFSADKGAAAMPRMERLQAHHRRLLRHRETGAVGKLYSCGMSILRSPRKLLMYL